MPHPIDRRAHSNSPYSQQRRNDERGRSHYSSRHSERQSVSSTGLVPRSQSQRDSELRHAAAGNETGTLQTLLSAGADPNAPSSSGIGSAVHIAARAGNTQALALLLNRGGDANLPNPADGYRTAVDYAAEQGISIRSAGQMSQDRTPSYAGAHGSNSHRGSRPSMAPRERAAPYYGEVPYGYYDPEPHFDENPYLNLNPPTYPEHQADARYFSQRPEYSYEDPYAPRLPMDDLGEYDHYANY